jgi:hypothetical protein
MQVLYIREYSHVKGYGEINQKVSPLNLDPADIAGFPACSYLFSTGKYEPYSPINSKRCADSPTGF